MPALNRVQLIGYLGKDPETRFTPTGRNVCRFSLAVTHRWKLADGEAKETTDWFNIEAWGKLGEICQSYLTKGRLVFLEGHLRSSRYEHEGEMRSITKVVINQMQMLDRKPEEPEPVVDEVEPVVEEADVEPAE